MFGKLDPKNPRILGILAAVESPVFSTCLCSSINNDFTIFKTTGFIIARFQLLRALYIEPHFYVVNIFTCFFPCAET